MEIIDIEKHNNNDEYCKHQRCSNDKLINMVKEFYDENGRIPTQNDFTKNPKYPHLTTYKTRFGKWSNVLDKAGFKTKKGRYTDDELLSFLTDFHKENGRVPTLRDFIGNSKYPSHSTYDNRFGSWNKALKMVGLDVDTLVKNGALNNSYQKGRLAELIVNNSFKGDSVDLSGENCNSPFDGICPKDKTYEVKSAQLVHNKINYNWKGWSFHLRNLQFDKIDYFILVAFNEDYKKVTNVWMVPRKFVENKNDVYVSVSNIYKMKEYEVSLDKCNLNI